MPMGEATLVVKKVTFAGNEIQVREDERC